jgi:phospholipid-binding lipoprotein MlaA
MKRSKGITLSLCLALLATGCKHTTNVDPFEAYNRPVFAFNQQADRFVLKPIARGYRFITPAIFRKGVGNVFQNIDEIPTAFNDVLQLQWGDALVSVWRGALNTTVGLGGIFDFAGHIGLKKHHNDFGLTLAHWGDTQSPYFLFPFFGPSTLRDSFAELFDYSFMSAYGITYFAINKKYVGLIGYGVYLGGKLNTRADLLDSEELIDELSVDPYVFQRDSYLQYRAAQINKTAESGGTDTYVSAAAETIKAAPPTKAGAKPVSNTAKQG